MPRKANTRRKDGRICVQVYIGRDKSNRRLYRSVYGKTQKEADEKALQIKLSLRKGLDVASARDSFAIWAERWLRMKEMEVSVGQYRSCACAVGHLASIRSMELGKIRPADIQDIITDLARHNPKTGRPTTSKTLKSIRSAASQIFRLAMDNRVIDYDPATAVRIPRVATQERRRALTPQEQRWIVETPHRAQTAAMILLYAGLRRGELIPLTWADINLAERTITVSKTVECVHSRFIVKPTAKTEASLRTIDIPKRLVDYLRALPRENALVCVNAAGTMHTQSSFERMWESYLIDLNLKYGYPLQKPKSKFAPEKLPMFIPRFTPHWLRHTYASNLYMAGVDVLSAKEQLGHSSIKTTLDIYTHLDRNHKRHSLSQLDAYLENV